MTDTTGAFRYRQKGDLQRQYTERNEVADHPGNEVQTLKIDTTCKWSHHNDEFMPGTFDTGCHQLFSFTEEGIRENGFNFCPYCGDSIEEVPTPAVPD